MAELKRAAVCVKTRPSMLATMEAALREVEAAINSNAHTTAHPSTTNSGGLPMAGRVAGSETSRLRGKTGMTALKQATFVMFTVGLLTAGGCVTSARHKEVVGQLEAELSSTKAELATNQQAMAEARTEMTKIQALIEQIDNARKVAKVDVQQAVASMEKLQAWVANTVTAIERLEASIGTDETSMGKVGSRLAAVTAKLSMPAPAEDAPVRVAESQKKE